MKQILLNLALIDLINFCKADKIDCSGSRIEKATRGFKYHLIKETTGQTIATVWFNKYSTPDHAVGV